MACDWLVTLDQKDASFLAMTYNIFFYEKTQKYGKMLSTLCSHNLILSNWKSELIKKIFNVHYGINFCRWDHDSLSFLKQI